MAIALCAVLWLLLVLGLVGGELALWGSVIERKRHIEALNLRIERLEQQRESLQALMDAAPGRTASVQELRRVLREMVEEDASER